MIDFIYNVIFLVMIKLIKNKLLKNKLSARDLVMIDLYSKIKKYYYN